MKYLVAIDASLHSTGIACFEDGKLKLTKLIQITSKKKGFVALFEMTAAVRLWLKSVYDGEVLNNELYCVVEEQHKREGNERMGAESFKYFASLPYLIGYPFFPMRLLLVKPGAWKGRVPKEIHQRRILDAEIKKYHSPYFLYKDKQSDILDAIGIGRWYLESK